MIPKPQETTLTAEEFAAMFTGSEHPADIRERMRALLDQLPGAARRVYNRENIQGNVSLLTVVETVLYHFDHSNRQRVAVALDMDYEQMLCLLIGYVLGRGE